MDLKKYIYSHCVSPVKVDVFDSYSQQKIAQYLPCGKCLHCRNTHVNEWVTRLYAQAMYSEYVYYITLDYSPFSYEKDTFTDSRAYQLAFETAACWNNLNKYHKFGMQPILLVKKHLQNFFKRFRKNTNHKIQYFACGEYGMHANNGKGYGRPHFHAIIFSDSVISHQEFIDAWSVDNYQIGNVDYHDITTQAKSPLNKNNTDLFNAKNCFKYVCKYLQKSSFEFEKLATIDFHRAYFDSLQFVCKNPDELFPEYEKIWNKLTLEENWKEYIAKYSPFVVCSRRPSIGLAYLQDNLERFKKQDFRLFGLQSEDLLLPKYFVKKTRESLCEFDVLGKESLLPCSSSAVGSRLSVLRSLLDHSESVELSSVPLAESWYICKNKFGQRIIDFGNGKYNLLSDFHFYDRNNKFFYQFTGTYYKVWARVRKLGYVLLHNMSIVDVLNEIQPKFNNLYDNYIVKMHRLKVLNEYEFENMVNLYCGTDIDRYDKFNKLVYSTYLDELKLNYKKDKLIINSKIEF